MIIWWGEGGTGSSSRANSTKGVPKFKRAEFTLMLTSLLIETLIIRSWNTSRRAVLAINPAIFLPLFQLIEYQLSRTKIRTFLSFNCEDLRISSCAPCSTQPSAEYQELLGITYILFPDTNTGAISQVESRESDRPQLNIQHPPAAYIARPRRNLLLLLLPSQPGFQLRATHCRY